MSPNQVSPIRDMFESLVPEYDRFNRMSSFGLDVLWRKELVGMFSDQKMILDVGTGTGDLARALANPERNIVGIDFASNMVKAAQEKLAANPNVSFQVGSAEALPFKANSFDGIASSFVIRNLHHGGILPQSFREFHRVLKSGGQMVHLELSRPPRGFLSWGHRAFIKNVLPLIGRFNFGNRWPKNYLDTTIENFPEPKLLCQQMRWSGFDRVCHYPLSGGIAGLYVGWRS